MAADHSIGTPEQLRDPDYTPPVAQAVVVGQAGVATGQEIHMPQQHRPGDHGISWGGF